ncbi:Thiosulfate sulfurtransferase PspE [Thalassocella blandensis]|nr:Thiosulfate sulfurtransferase PspE [Thalassocella blandensis]
MKKIVIPLIIIFLFFTNAVMAETYWIDVRSEEEYKADHISGDTRITYTEIVPRVTALIPDKNADIVLYCRSGRRAGLAKEALEAMGYLHVVNGGSIDDVRAARKTEK